MFKNFFMGLEAKRQGMKRSVRKLVRENKGSGIVEVLMIIAIVVIVGAIVIGLLKVFVPDFFNGLTQKARNVFEL